jgi:pyruvate, water dikinase
MFESLKRFFCRQKPAPAAKPADAGFAAQHQAFNLFLTAWDGFQDTLSTMEYTLCCERPFDMSRVRALATAAVTRCYQCIKLLDVLNGSKKDILREHFHVLQEVITPLLEEGEDACLLGPAIIDLTKPLSAADHASLEQLADKVTRRFIRLEAELGARYPHLIPPSFVLTAAGTQRILRTRGMQAEVSGCIQKAGGITPRTVYKIAAQVEKIVLSGLIPAQVAQDFFAHVRRLQVVMQGQPATLLLRGRLWQDTSPDEDHGVLIWGPEVDLYAPDDALLEALRATLARKFSAQCLTYRRYRGMKELSGASFCVLCMAVPQFRISGLVHTMNPMQASHAFVHVYAWRGTPAAAEYNDVPVDEFHVLRRQPHAVLLSTPAECTDPVLDDEQLVAATEMALAVEEKEQGTAMSLTWILRPDGEFTLVMGRPMVLGGKLQPEVIMRESLPSPLLNWGITAASGIAAGPVTLVRCEKDAKTFPDGGILVVEHDSYSWAALLDRAAGLIVQEGFLGSRLASICREFGKPALFNVPECMEKLEDVETVTLCADTGLVYAGTVAELLVHAAAPRDFLPQSTVYAALKEIIAHTAPLTIMPDTPDFRATNCKTFHDIARYCHEKAVSAMFSLGSAKEHAPQRVKQLFDGMPKQFWVIDLGEAFESVGRDPMIDVSQIQCPSFHALWFGMNVHPWQGPPPVNNKGFVSILYEATANPHLDPASQSAYFSEKNYFLLSKNYCSLYSRFGFHFVATEARLGGHKQNNSLVFQLRGGAANVERRMARVRFVADILWECGFDPMLLHDSVRARVSNIAIDEGLAMLSVLGYLTIHTRQLDMIMTDKRQVAERKEKMLEHCRSLLLMAPRAAQL